MLAATPGLIAVLAVTVIEPGDARALQLAIDLGLVVLVLVAAAIEDRTRPVARMRSRKRDVERRRHLGRTVAFATIAAVAATTVAVSLAPVIRNRAVDVPGLVGSNQQGLDEFADVYQRLLTPSGKELFVATPLGRSLPDRYVVTRLTRYDGERFSVDRGGGATIPDVGEHVYRFEIRSLGGNRLPAPEGTIEVSSGSSTGGTVHGAATPGLRYSTTAVGPIVPGLAEAATIGRYDPITRGTAAIDPAIIERTPAIAGGGSDLEKALTLERWFRETGSFTYEVSRGATDLTDWMFDEDSANYRTGYCEQFALGMAVMARAVEIPSRIVIGTTAGTPLGDGSVVVRDYNAHAWVELWIRDQGWVRFDPTPRNDAVTTDPTYLTAGLQLTEPPSSEATTTTIPEEFGDAAQASPGDSGGRPGLLLMALTLTGFVVVVAVAVSSRRRDTERRRAEAGDVTAAWRATVQRLTDLGQPPRPSLTPIELAEEVDEAMQPLASVYTKTAYSTSSPTSAERRRATESMRLTDARLTDRSSRTRRMLAVVGLGRVLPRRR